MTTEDEKDIKTSVDEDQERSPQIITNMDDAKVIFDENFKAFQNYWPSLAEQLRSYNPMSELVFLDNGEPDVLFKGTYLYKGEGAYTYTRQQIDTFWKSPRKLYTNFPDPNSIDPHGREALVGTLDDISDNVAFNEMGNLRDAQKAHYVMLMGLGLGIQLYELLETTRGSVVVIAESNFEFIFHSLFVCDWNAFFDLARENDVQIELIQSSNTKEIASVLGGVFRKHNPTTIDGAVIFQLYPSSTYKNATEHFIKKIFPVALMGLGFFLDELNMIAQSYKNLSTGKHRILKNLKEKTLTNVPAVIVGNGPSLDDHYKYLKAIKDKAVIISCGTAIDALLAEGIVPDFQIQLERDIGEFQLYKHTASKHDLSSICLIASTTIYPGIADLFGETIFFFRPGLSSMPTFMVSEDEKLSNPDPSVTNGGISFALNAGFKEIYFFGTDAGTKDKSLHHSKNSLYHSTELDLPWYLNAAVNTALVDSFNIEVPGNFGGTAVTNDILYWTKTNIEAVVRTDGVGCVFYNCSDGALIEGVNPLLPSRIRIPELAVNKQKLLSNFVNMYPIYTKSMLDKVWKKADIFNRLEKMAEDLIATMDEYPNLEDQRYSNLMMKYLKPASSSDGVSMVYRGTVFLYQIALHYYLNRAQNEEMVVEVREIFRKHFIKLINQLRDEAIAYFRDAENDKIEYDQSGPTLREKPT